MKYIESRVKETKKRRGKSQDLHSKDRLVAEEFLSSPDQLKSPRERNTPQR